VIGNLNKISVVQPPETEQLAIFVHKWEDITMDVKETRREDVEYVSRAQNIYQCWTL
jgi:hypothetical protein